MIVRDRRIGVDIAKEPTPRPAVELSRREDTTSHGLTATEDGAA
jgi:hypothetical protein